MDPIRVGVVGAGFFGRLHARTYCDLPQAALVAVADVDGSRADFLAKELEVAAHDDPDELLGRDDIDAVSICVPDQLHRDPTLAALDAGKHVLLEKPIATSFDDIETIAAAARSSSRKVMVGHVLRFHPRYLAAKQAFDDHQIGEPISIFTRRTNLITVQERLQGRTSVFMFLGVHDFDLARWFAGSEVQRVYCEAVQRVLHNDGFAVEDAAFVTMRFANGIIGCSELGWILPPTHPSGHDFRFEVTGAAGVITVDERSDGVTVCSPSGVREPYVSGGLRPELEHFLECIAIDCAPMVTIADAVAAARIALAAEESALTGEVVSL